MFKRPEQANMLVPYEDLECLLEADFDNLTAMLDETLADADGPGAFIDDSFDLAKPSIVDYTRYLARAFDSTLDPEAAVAAHHAFHFAYSIAQLTLSHQPVVSIQDYYERPDDEITLMQRHLHADTQLYLQHRPKVDAIIGRYMPELDPSGRWAMLVEVVAASTFMFVDRGEAALAAEAVGDELSAEIDNWSGSF